MPIDQKENRRAVAPILSVRHLSLKYPARAGLSNSKRTVAALKDVSFDIFEGETLGLIGESGSGKSTIARCLALLEKPDQGEIWFRGSDILKLDDEALLGVRRELQMVFQDSATSINPRQTVRQILAEPLSIHRFGTPDEIQARILELLNQTNLSLSLLERHPLELSGGQRQRVAIARAIALRPRLIVLDETLSALDLSTRGQIANLLLDLQKDYQLSYLFISHEKSLIAAMADRVAIIHEGQLDSPISVLTTN